MVRIGIAEDDQGYIDQLQGYLSEYPKETGETFWIQVFRDGMQLAFDDQPVYDILLLDVVLTEKSLYCGDGSHDRGRRAPVKRKNMPRPMSEKPRTKRPVRDFSAPAGKNQLGSPE